MHAEHIEERLLQPSRLETILASIIDRRQERTKHRREHLAELHRRITEPDQRLNRLHDTTEAGVAHLEDTALKERIAGLKAIREQTTADVERIQAVSPCTARERLWLESGDYRRDHLRALAQRVEVADKKVRIMGSKSELLRTLVAASSGKSAAFGVLY